MLRGSTAWPERWGLGGGWLKQTLGVEVVGPPPRGRQTLPDEVRVGPGEWRGPHALQDRQVIFLIAQSCPLLLPFTSSPWGNLCLNGMHVTRHKYLRLGILALPSLYPPPRPCTEANSGLSPTAVPPRHYHRWQGTHSRAAWINLQDDTQF